MRPVTLVTGAAGGIGQELIRVFVAAGHEVVGTDHATGQQPPGCRFLSLDLSIASAAEELIASIRAEEGRLDVIVNNAALQAAHGLGETTDETWDRVMAVNVRAPFLLARQGRDLLRRQGGSIVNVASVHAVATSVGLTAYATSKGALVALTRSLALELSRDRIRVNAVLPGAVDTRMLEEGLRRSLSEGGSIEQQKAELARRTPIGRLGHPADIAEAALFLADDARSGFMTGQVLTVDGGALAQLSTE